MKELTDQLHAKVNLSRSQVLHACEQLASQDINDAEKASFLAALRDKGETGEEVGYFAEAFLAMSLAPAIQVGEKPTIDLCGTGGDRLLPRLDGVPDVGHPGQIESAAHDRPVKEM